MKKYHLTLSLATMAFLALNSPLAAQSAISGTQNQTIRVGIVNTKKCLEQSKYGKQEQANFEKMKTQMETVLQEKERAMEDLQSKLNDDDYMDSISEEAAADLKRKRRTVQNEGMQLQNQYMQTLQQANMKIIQKLTDILNKASTKVAQDNINGEGYDIVLSDEACTYFVPRMDISELVIAKMDALYDAEQKESASKN